MEFALPWSTTGQIANSLLTLTDQKLMIWKEVFCFMIKYWNLEIKYFIYRERERERERVKKIGGISKV